eukprot:CAMPEP_0117777752 /NCGR_PEP_ID=MMETSP0948-20121206/573_1 /TAXON_ID=44440 /ORGANISM="Chattonella subsalsa, Strain CCMP2191" /LENGTH=89 /DNA_ID=CAMNT_0005604923 /DNA_START=300 /DNA_END=569 /DNA_ORIENTATION=-
MGYSDRTHIGFLVFLNLMEFVTNAVYMISPEFYFYFAIATEALCPFLMTFRMKRRVGVAGLGSPKTQKGKITGKSSSGANCPYNYIKET